MGNRNRTAGIKAELKIANELKELGFDKVVTTRYESKRLDDSGVDITQLPNPTIELPCYVQVKRTLQTPKMELLHVETEKPVAIVFLKQEKKKTRFFTTGEYAILEKELFYELLKYYVIHNTRSTNRA